jgi:hypothetical protein
MLRNVALLFKQHCFKYVFHQLLSSQLVSFINSIVDFVIILNMDKEQTKKVLDDIKKKDHSQLKHVIPKEKNILPTQQDIETEKKASSD